MTPEHLAAIEQIKENGFVLIADALTSEECEKFRQFVFKMAKSSKTYSGGYLRESNILEREIGFSELLDHSKTYPIIKTLLGGYARIMSTEAIIRPRMEDDPVRWHEDGPNAPSYRSLATPCPTMQLKVGWFLNDILEDGAGNLIVLPKSHMLPSGPPADLAPGREAIGALSVKAKAGTAIIFHSALWHCVDVNITDSPRINIYYGYCLPWMAPFDRSASSISLRSLLTCERRRLLMDFETPSANYALIKEVWRGDPKLANASLVRMLHELLIRRLKKIKRAILGNSIN
jgi:hypothetical protein